MLGIEADDDGGTDPEVDLKLNLSWWEIQAKLGFREKESVTEFTTTAGQREYVTGTSIDSTFEALQSVTVKDIHTDRFEPLVMKGYEQIEGMLSTEFRDQEIPQYYACYNDKLVLWPTPNAEYTIRARYLKTLVDAQSQGFPIPQEWSEPILLGAVYRGWRARRDWDAANAARADRDSLIATLSLESTKENTSKVASVHVLRRRYP